MQPKINAFFKRQAPKPDPNSGADEARREGGGAAEEKKRPKSSGCADGKVLNKKRNYAQFHLELGQADFLLHMCSVCGMMYARGNDDDEKVHRAYHKSYFEGHPFKGWRDETVVARSEGGDRIILATGENSCTRNSKMQIAWIYDANNVMSCKYVGPRGDQMVEKELGFGEGQLLLHKLCKVYLFISVQRIVGCLVVEPIRAAHKVIPSSTAESCSELTVSKTESGKTSHTLEFGKFIFKREVLRWHNHCDKNKEECQGPGAIICEEEAVAALCGFRAITEKKANWVAANGCCKLASHCKDWAFLSCAFTPPTSAGKVLASSYCKTSAFLVYRDGDV